MDKKAARLNCIRHLLEQVRYGEVPRVAVKLPPRERHDGYRRSPVPTELLIPEYY